MREMKVKERGKRRKEGRKEVAGKTEEEREGTWKEERKRVRGMKEGRKGWHSAFYGRFNKPNRH